MIVTILAAVIKNSEVDPEDKKRMFEAATTDALVNYAVACSLDTLNKLQANYGDHLSKDDWDFIGTVLNQTVFLCMLMYTEERVIQGVKVEVKPSSMSDSKFLETLVTKSKDGAAATDVMPAIMPTVIDRVVAILMERLAEERESVTPAMQRVIRAKITDLMNRVLFGYYIQGNF